jgi:peptidoglycan L-alanyl-D-glutamate endopeptidase CwlK
MINSRDIKELHPKVQEMCLNFLTEAKRQGIDVIVTSTYRDHASQNALYAQGRTTPGKKVTNARGGQSFHNWRVAFDFVPLVNGKAQWNDLDTFKRCGEIGKAQGLEWAGDWKTFKEYAHFQYTGGLSLKDLQSGKTI